MTVRALESEWSKQRLEAMWALKEGSYLEESFNSWLFPLEIPTVQSMRTQARAQAVIFTELRQQWWKSGAPRASRSWGEPSEWKQSRRESLKFTFQCPADPWLIPGLCMLEEDSQRSLQRETTAGRSDDCRAMGSSQSLLGLLNCLDFSLKSYKAHIQD